MTMKAHTYYTIFGRLPIGGKLPPSPWRRHWSQSLLAGGTVCRRPCVRDAVNLALGIRVWDANGVAWKTALSDSYYTYSHVFSISGTHTQPFNGHFFLGLLG